MLTRVMITLHEKEVAPRFDLSSEVMLAIVSSDNIVEEQKTIALPRASAEDLCQWILTQGVTVLICGAIEDEYYQFLKWKKLSIFDNISGDWHRAFDSFLKNCLHTGDNFSIKTIQGRPV